MYDMSICEAMDVLRQNPDIPVFINKFRGFIRLAKGEGIVVLRMLRRQATSEGTKFAIWMSSTCLYIETL